MRYNMSTVRVITHPSPDPLLSLNSLQLNLTRRHFRSTTSHPRQQISASYSQCCTFRIPQISLFYDAAASSFVEYVCQEIRVDLSVADVYSLVSYILCIGSGTWGDDLVCLVASLDIEHSELLIGDDVVMPDYAALLSVVDDSIILDAAGLVGGGGSSPSSSSGSVSYDASNTAILLKEITVDRGSSSCGDVASCSICLEEFERGCSAMITPCSHLFHGECISKWIQRRTNKAGCPLCRFQLVA